MKNQPLRLIPRALAVFLLASGPALATINALFVGVRPGTDFDNPDPVFTVIDSDEANPDPAYFRNAAPAVARVNFSFSFSGTLSETATYRVCAELVDSQGKTISLVDPDAGKVTEFCSAPRKVTLGVLDPPEVVDFPLLTDPVATLLKNERYHLECRLEIQSGLNWVPVAAGGPSDSPELPAFHFTSTDPEDLALNIHTATTELVWRRTHLIDTISSRDSLRAEVKVALGRYDGWDIDPKDGTAALRVDFDLHEAGGDEIPLEDGGIVTKNIALQSHLADGRPLPLLIPETEVTADLIPQVQLASRGQTYVLTATVSHLEIPRVTYVDDETITLPAERLLHFNGTLRFNTIDTQMLGVLNTPPVSSLQPAAVRSEIVLSPLGGVLPDRPDLGFGSGVPLTVDLDDGGVATVIAGVEEIVTIEGTEPVIQEIGNLEVEFGTPTLSPGGAQTASVIVHFPQGLGVITDSLADPHHAENRWSFGGQPLTDSIGLTAPLAVTLGANARMFDEGHPLIYDVTAFSVALNGRLQFDVTGSEHINAAAYNSLQTLPAAELDDPVAMRERLSNDTYLHFVSVDTAAPIRVEASPFDGSSRCTAVFDLEPGEFRSHFPYAASVKWNGFANFAIFEGMVDFAEFPVADPVQLSYDIACGEDLCSQGAPSQTPVTMTPENGLLNASRSGGITGIGAVPDVALSWGWRGDGAGGLEMPDGYTHRTGEFRQARFYMPGYRLLAEENPLLDLAAYADTADRLAPGVLLLEAFDQELDFGQVVRPETSPYREGVGDYAGLTFVVENGGFEGASKIAGNDSDYLYELLPSASKYYIRRSGVSGRHPATDGSFDPFMELYGFGFEVSQLQLTFLSSENVDSWFDGRLSIPAPSDFTQQFKGLMLTCTGGIDGPMEIDPADTGEKVLRDWFSTIHPRVYEFKPVTEPVPPNDCYPPRTLIVGATTEVAHVPTALAGQLEFLQDGRLGTALTGNPDHDSRLGLPASLSIEGPQGRYYTVNPVTELYFTDPTLAPDGIGQVAFAASMDVPYFEDLKIHVTTSANPDPEAALYLAGGWLENGTETFFNKSGFDAVHRGWPAALSKDEYLSPNESTDAEYLIHARQSLFGLIPLDYPLRWSDGGRYFRSMSSAREDLFILRDTYNQIDFLGPENAEISFGAQYEGLPQINLTSLAVDVVDEQLGASQAIADAATGFVRDAIDDGIDDLGAMVGDNLERALDSSLDQIEADILTPLHAALAEGYMEAMAADPSATFDDWVNTSAQSLKGVVHESFTLGGGATDSVRQRLAALGAASDDAQAVLHRIDAALVRAILAIDAVAGQLEIDDGAPQLDPVEVDQLVNGLLTKVNVGGEDQYQILQRLVGYLMRDLLGPEFASALQPLVDELTAAANAEINGLLEDVEPALDRIVAALQETRGTLQAIRTRLEEGEEIFQQFDSIVDQALNSTNEIDNLLAGLETLACDWITQQAASAGISPTSRIADHADFFEEFSPAEIAAYLRGQLRDRLLASEFIRQIQFALRHALYDVDLALRSAIDSVFEETNRVIRDLLKESLGPIDDAINGLIGQLNEFTGAGGIDGYAHVEGDSLKRLRIDARWQMKVPDDLEFHAYVEILAYDSGDDFEASACLAPGEKALEVRIGVEDVPLDWISPDLRAAIHLKFAMNTTGTVYPKGFSGEFRMTGSLDFQSFELKELVAVMGFTIDPDPNDGADGREAYLGAAIRMRVNSYEAAGGFFIGRTCSIDPIHAVDPDASDLLGDPPFAGGLCYAEVHIPVSEVVLGIPATCFFNISAGVGAGAYFLVDGPTFGGKMLMSVSGEALCVVSIKGEVIMIGIYQGGDLRLRGKGTLSGKAGWCPFCLKFKKSATVTYDAGSWDVDL